MERVGIIAGCGRLPHLVAKGAKKEGKCVLAFAIEDEADPGLCDFVDNIFWIKIGQLKKLINMLKREEVSHVIMAGGVRKKLIFSNVKPDLAALFLLAKLKFRGDDAILRAFAETLEKEGIKVLDSTTYISDQLATPGVMTKKSPKGSQWKDIEYGKKIAKELGRIDIGQCVVVKNRVVLAVEAIEGTDEVIKRASRFGGDGIVVVKVAKPNQDTRFDLPVVGERTIECIKEAGGGVLAVEAKKTIMIEKSKMLNLANSFGIPVVGV